MSEETDKILKILYRKYPWYIVKVGMSSFTVGTVKVQGNNLVVMDEFNTTLLCALLVDIERVDYAWGGITIILKSGQKYKYSIATLRLQQGTKTLTGFFLAMNNGELTKRQSQMMSEAIQSYQAFADYLESLGVEVNKKNFPKQ